MGSALSFSMLPTITIREVCMIEMFTSLSPLFLTLRIHSVVYYYTLPKIQNCTITPFSSCAGSTSEDHIEAVWYIDLTDL